MESEVIFRGMLAALLLVLTVIRGYYGLTIIFGKKCTLSYYNPSSVPEWLRLQMFWSEFGGRKRGF